MGKLFDSINPDHCRFIETQKMFFVATAPLAATGRINLSPKGLDSFRVLSPNRVAYLDLHGSGNETSAHVLENGRITLMFCAFDGSPMILRLYGHGRTILPESAGWNELIGLFPDFPKPRQIIDIEVRAVGTSCGNAVPLYDFVAHRDKLVKWIDNKTDDQMRQWQQRHNAQSLDGLVTQFGKQSGDAASK